MKNIFMWNYICRAIAFVCITLAAMFFNSRWVLCWYLVPLFMDVSVKEKSEDKDVK